MSLENYLAGQYNRDLQDLVEVDAALTEIASTFLESYDPKEKCWPYQLTTRDTTIAGKPSHGTTAMLLSSIGKILDEQSIPRVLGDTTTDRLRDMYQSALDALTADLEGAKAVTSGTFGKNNPLTINLLAELENTISVLDPAKNKFRSAIRSASGDKVISDLVSKDPGSAAEFSAALPDNEDDHWCAKSAFVALRVVRARESLEGTGSVTSVHYREFFENRLHEQLSFSSIPDSRFDPADLVFSLEGLLLCAREGMDPILFERVLAVLAAQQETSAYWRPSRPFMAWPTGEIVLPISVEGANSLLRSIQIKDGDKLHGTFAATTLPMLRRFWQWLRARKVKFHAAGKNVAGWHSEHINEISTIHLWDTSQVTDFLIAFRQLLQRHIARETLVLSRVKIEEPETQGDWPSVANKYEPLSSVLIADQMFSLVYDDFVKPWSDDAPKNYSMLLYGPPGTGKTVFAKSVANALKFRLVTVTVSDFLGTGGELVEARAKAIFQMLEAQSDCVVLFDEIDAFLLDRDSKHYHAQSTLFQFLTPGMLTKFNDLRQKKRIIFIIATNYANRIDPAIKRPGRIDKQYLLLPPDLGKRKAIVEKLLEGGKFSDPDLTEMAAAALFLGYKEIEGAIKRVKGSKKEDVTTALTGAPRSSNDQVYLARIGGEQFAKAEYLAIVRMANEAGKVADVKANIDALDADKTKLWKQLLDHDVELKDELDALGVIK